MNKQYCTYITHYLGELLPPWYIGSTSIEKIKNGYNGSVSSKKYKEIWKQERKNNPHLFKTRILRKFYRRKISTLFELKMQKKHNVVENKKYINMSYANKKFGMDINGKNNPMYQKEKSKKTINAIKKANKNKVVVKDKDGNIFKVKDTDPRYLSGEFISESAGKIVVKDKDGNSFRVSLNNPRYINGEFKLFGQNKVVIRDKEGNISQVEIDDPRYLNNELVPINKNKIQVQDSNGNIFKVLDSDLRYLSGELIPFSKNTMRTKNKEGDILIINKKDLRYISGEFSNSLASSYIIYDINDNIIHKVETNFKKFCKENSLPFEAFKKSYNLNIPVNSKKSNWIEKYKKFIGWYCIKI